MWFQRNCHDKNTDRQPEGLTGTKQYTLCNFVWGIIKYNHELCQIQNRTRGPQEPDTGSLELTFVYVHAHYVHIKQRTQMDS